MPIGVGVIRPATGGLTEVLKFYAGVRLPIHNVEFSREGATKEGYTRGKKLDVFGLPFQPNNYDVILGMDIISLFHITFFKSRFIISN